MKLEVQDPIPRWVSKLVCRRLQRVLIVLVPMMRHLTDEDRGKEHEDKRLQESDKKFKETDHNSGDH